ncbi:LysR family transcriptional regulator [Gordonia defluvii]|jgi:molybdate transport repressor ModE-like protein|uniref:LysR family transcriptional regulator n=1 Tax=Gordonia defluvii TaxID=283718 RepID=A0ABP6L7H0_9ACTN
MAVQRPNAGHPAAAPISIDQVRADDLRFLHAVARSGSRSVAAADLGVDTSTVTRRIRALEKALGVRLVEHGVSGWVLTDTGRTVATAAGAIEAAVGDAIAAVEGSSSSALRGHARVTAPDGFGAYFVAPALVRLRARHPELTVELITTTRQLNLYQSGFDVAISVGAAMSRQLVSEQIAVYELGLYATRDYLEMNGEPAAVADLRNHPLIWYVDALLRVEDLDLDKHIPGLAAQFGSTSIFGQVEATRAGGGIGLLPVFVARRHGELRRVLAEQVAVRLGFTLAARRERITNPVVEAIRAAIHDEVRDRAHELVDDRRAKAGD